MTEIRDAENKNIYKLNGHFEDLFYKRLSILLYKVTESKSNTHLLYNAFLANDYTDQYIARPHLKGASHKILSMVKNRNPFVTSRVTLKLCTAERNTFVTSHLFLCSNHTARLFSPTGETSLLRHT